MKILIIEDEKNLALSLQTLLESREYETTVCFHGTTGYETALSASHDLIILDIMLPGMDGYEIARRLRSVRNGTPILMLTAKSDLMDRVTGLNSGADYYLTKPFDNRELIACVQALLRRQETDSAELCYGNTSLSLETGELGTCDHTLRLSARELAVMTLLMQSGGRNLSKETILDRVWGYDSDAVENHVEVYVGFLRKKLTAIHSSVRIVSIRRLGYHLELEE